MNDGSVLHVSAKEMFHDRLMDNTVCTYNLPLISKQYYKSLWPIAFSTAMFNSKRRILVITKYQKLKHPV